MFHYWMKVSDKTTKKSKIAADLFLPKSINELGEAERQINFYKIDLNRYNVKFIERQVKQNEKKTERLCRCPFLKS